MRETLCDKCAVWPRWCECDECSCTVIADQNKADLERYRIALGVISELPANMADQAPYIAAAALNKLR